MTEQELKEKKEWLEKEQKELELRIAESEAKYKKYKEEIKEKKRKMYGGEKVIQHFKGDVIITDPCYIIDKNNDNDWDKCGYGDDMSLLGLKTYISENTIYGDWGCTTYELKQTNSITDIEEAVTKFTNGDENELAEMKIGELGRFCADAGEVGVFLLDEVLKYNPKFDYHINRKWTTTLIKDFDGEIEYFVSTHEYKGRKERTAHIIGVGNKNFCTLQTSL